MNYGQAIQLGILEILYMANDKITVITINYNNAEGLSKTIASVEKQTNKEFEYLIIDGGSEDNSIEHAKKSVI
ncbi:glycosyltransferase, partial [Escherichia coli]